MKNNNSSFRWLRLRFRRSLAASLVAFMVWPMLLPAISLAETGSIHTTDETGTVQDKNNYTNDAETVFLNGETELPEGTVVTYEIRRLPNPIVKTQTIVVDANGDWSKVPIFTPAEYGPWITDSHTEFHVDAFRMDGNNKQNIGGDNFWVDTAYSARISKTVSDPEIYVTENTTYTITFENLTNAPLNDVVVTDNVPAGLTYAGGTPYTTGPPNLSWNLGTVERYGTRTITVVVTGTTVGEKENTAEGTADSKQLKDPVRDSVIINVIDKPADPTYGLDVDKSVSDANIDDGEDTTFTIRVENTGNTTLSNVDVEDTLPSGLVYVGSDPGATLNLPNLNWTIATLEPGTGNAWTATVTVRGDNDGDGSIDCRNIAVASHDEQELSEDDDATVVVNPKPDEPDETYGLDVDKSVSDANIDDGEDTTFTIRVENTGNTTLSNVDVEDTLPSGLVYVDSDPDSEGTAPNLSWTIATLEPGTGNAWTATVTVKGDNDGKDSIERTNWAVASHDEQELEEDDNATVVVNPRPDEPDETYGLDVEKTVSDNSIYVGENTTFTISVENTGTMPLYGVKIVDDVPAGLTVNNTDPSPEDDGNATDQHYEWLLNLYPGETREIKIGVTGASAGKYDNTAVGNTFEGEGPGDEDTVGGEVLGETRQLETSYTITKSDLVDPVVVGEDTTYTLTVRNTGETTLTDVSVYDTMPAGLEYVSAEPAPYITSPLGWHVPDLGPGSDPYVIKVRAKALTVGKWTNNAHVHVGELPAVYAYEDTEVSAKPTINETTPTPPLAPVVAPATYDLSINKIDDVDPAYVGDTVTYTMTVKNIGDQPLTSLAFRDTLPTGMTYKSSSSTSIKQSTVGAYAWSLSVLAPGESRKFTITTTANAVGNWKNTVSVTAKELPTAVQAAERTQVLALVAQAPQTIVSDANTGNSSLPLTGFPLTAWWLATATIIAAGLWLEISTRRKKRLS